MHIYMASQSLVIGAVFKNESHILREWLLHHMREGCTHFILIDNGSTDSPKDILQPFIDQNLVLYIRDCDKHDQIGKYNRHILPLICHFPIQVECEWIAILDLDEFLYSRHTSSSTHEACIKLNSKNNLIENLSKFSIKVGQISVPWKMFGSAGQKQQPPLVIDGFCQRQTYEKPTFVNIKSIIRPEALKSFGIHEHEMKEDWDHLDCLGRQMHEVRPEPQLFLPSSLVSIDEVILQQMPLHINHYAVQSFEWFCRIKMTRGSANCAVHDTIRNLQYFKEYDHNEKIDSELKLQKHHKEGCLISGRL